MLLFQAVLLVNYLKDKCTSSKKDKGKAPGKHWHLYSLLAPSTNISANHVQESIPLSAISSYLLFLLNTTIIFVKYVILINCLMSIIILI